MAFPSREVLDQALSDILAAPKDGAAISRLCLRPGRGRRNFVDQIQLTQIDGIPGERWKREPWMRTPDGAPHAGIQVCILPTRILDLVWQAGSDDPHPGDTFTADMNMSEANLPEGQLLSVGTAVLRVSEVFNNGCAKWKGRYGADALDWVRAPENQPLRLRGLLCSIERDGMIRTGDVLQKIDIL